MSMIDPKGSREALVAMAVIRAHKSQNQPYQASFIPGSETSNPSSNKRLDNLEESYG